MNSKDVGDISVANIIARLLEFGYVVSVPFGDNLRYDIIVDTGDKLLRVQCKTAWLSRGCLDFNNTSITTKNGRRVSRLYSSNEIDLMLVYSPNFSKIYSVPIGLKHFKLRVDPTKDGRQRKDINWAKDYEFNGDVTQR